MRISEVDLIIVLLYLAGVTLFGVRFRRQQQSVHDYFLGGRKAPWWALSLSIVATETSTLTVIYTPALAFAGNLGFLQLVLGYIVGRILIALYFIPQYFRGEFYTAYQLIEKCFGAQMRSVAAGTFLFTRALADGVRIAAVALVVSVAFGTGEVAAVVLITLLTLIYTFEGGLKAVIWTDVMQLTIYLGGSVAALFVLLGKIPGGWAEVGQVAAAAGKWQVFDFSWQMPAILLEAAKTYTFWSGLIGGTFLTLASHGTDQLIVQRLLAARSERESKLALLASAAVVFLQFALFLIIGVVLYAYHQHAPLIPPQGDPNRVFPEFIVRDLPVGLAGLLIAAVFAAAMSTTSSSLNSLASSSVIDFYRARGAAADPQRLLRLSRRMTLVWGAVLLVFGIVPWQGLLLEAGLRVASVTYGGLLGLFLLGMMNRRATPRGALVGMFAGLGVMAYVWLGTKLVLTWYVLVGTSVTFIVGSLASLLMPDHSREARAE